MRTVGIILALTAALAGTTAGSPAVATDADAVFLGRFLTLDPQRPEAEAVAVRHRRIVAVGSRTEVDREIGADVRRVLIRGIGVPGLADAHVHALAFGEQLEVLDLRGLQKEDILRKVAEAVKGAAAGIWIEGRGWDHAMWPQPVFPTAVELDKVTGENPVVLTRIDGHSVWLNSAALRRAGITAATPDPPGGRIARLPDGAAEGVLIDEAVGLVRRVTPKPSHDQLRRRLDAALSQYVRWGLTSIHDAGVNAEGIGLYRELAAAGRLPLRAYVMAQAPGETMERLLRSGPEIDAADGRLTIRSFKVFIDGALGSRGAELLEPYADVPSDKGLSQIADEDLGSLVTRATARGFQVNAHAIGDLAVRRALDAFERFGGPDVAARRFRVEHASVVTDQDLPRFARLGVVASLQPGFVGVYSRSAADRLGGARAARVLRTADFLKAGVRIAAGSDYPAADSGNPLLSLYSMVTRKGIDGRPVGGWHPDQRVDVTTALHAMTSGAAYAAFEEGTLGAISVGRLADFTVLSEDPRRVEPERLKDLLVTMTVVGGATVFDSSATR